MAKISTADLERFIGRYSIGRDSNPLNPTESLHFLRIKVLGDIFSGDVLEVVLDNPPSVRDIPPALREKGYDVSDAERVERGTWKIVVQTKK